MLRTFLATFVFIVSFTATPVFAQTDSARQKAPADTLLERNDASLLKDTTAPVENAFRSLMQDSVPVSITDSIKSELTTPVTPKPLSFRSIAIPTAMIAYGAFTFANKDLKNLNLAVREGVWEKRGNNEKQFPLDNFSLVAPAVAVYALNFAGVKGKNNLIDRTIIFGMSNLIGHGIVSSTKRLSGVIRPDSSNRLSFPSGHTSQAFISAEFLRQEYKDVSPWIGVAGYAVAAGTGFLRMYNNRHWLNDVVAGAGVGILSTRLSYWLYPKLKNTFLKGRKTDTVIMPTYQNGAIGVGMVMQIK